MSETAPSPAPLGSLHVGRYMAEPGTERVRYECACGSVGMFVSRQSWAGDEWQEHIDGAYGLEYGETPPDVHIAAQLMISRPFGTIEQARETAQRYAKWAEALLAELDSMEAVNAQV